MTLTLTSDSLQVVWDTSRFTDVEPQLLSFTVALGGCQYYVFGVCACVSVSECVSE